MGRGRGEGRGERRAENRGGRREDARCGGVEILCRVIVFFTVEHESRMNRYVGSERVHFQINT